MLAGRAFLFQPDPGSYIVFAGDDHGTALELYPLKSEVVPADGDQPRGYQTNHAPPRFTATHVLVSLPVHRGQEDVERIATREGWRAPRCWRGVAFEVIEFWLENRLLIELLSAELLPAYLAAFGPRHWEQRLAAI